MPVLLDSYVYAQGPQFYVAASGGSDANPGTAASPWATVAFAVDQLAAGDTLNVGGGTYYESNITVTVDGTSTDPILIRAKPGETPIIDGSLSAFRTAGNTAWTVHSGHIYKSVSTFASPGDFGYTGHIDEAGTLYQLTAYNDGVGTGLDSLSATSDLFEFDASYYMGPGVTYNAADSKIYVRLDPNSSAAQWGTVTPFAFGDVDPRTHAIYLAPNNGGFDISGDWVVVEGIELRNHWTALGGTGADITIRDCAIKPGRFGARVEADRWTFDGCTIEHFKAPWCARSDVKSGAEPAKDTRTGGVSWEGGVDHVFTGGTIRGAFDGMLVLADQDGLTVTDTLFDACQDDGAQMGSAAVNIEFGRCTFTASGISHDGSGTDSSTTPDSVYVHHCVFDNTATVFWSRKPVVGDDPADNSTVGYEHCHAIGSHAVPDYDDPWKIYNNTFVNYFAPGSSGVLHFMYHGDTAGTGHHEAYNNLINFHTEDIRVYRNANAFSGLEAYDYNIYARTTPLGQFAIESVDETNTPRAVTSDFSTWQTQMGTFDAHSVDQSTMVSLNGNYEPAVSGPADGTGVNLSATGWPGTTPGTTYIGAKAPV